MTQDIHGYLAGLEDIPGTRVFTASRARAGYHLNRFGMSLMKAENRARFKANERAYLDEWPMSEDQKQAVLDRELNRAIDLGEKMMARIPRRSAAAISPCPAPLPATGTIGSRSSSAPSTASTGRATGSPPVIILLVHDDLASAFEGACK